MVETLPEGTTFLFDVTNIQPTISKCSVDKKGRWIPPVLWRDFTPPAVIPDQIWRWKHGDITREDNTQKLHGRPKGNPHIHGVATVFARIPNLDEFVAFPHDVRRLDVEKAAPNRWMELGFNHTPVTGHQGEYYNYVASIPDQHTFITPTQSSWRHLFTPRYNPETAADRESVNAGLTGELPLILALVAFSCESQHLEEVLKGTRLLGAWNRHEHPHGREYQRAGSGGC